MIEFEWDRCTDPKLMVESLWETDKASDRKYRLFACACCRRVWHHFDDERSRWAVEVGERYADRQASVEELADAEKGARAAHDEWVRREGMLVASTYSTLAAPVWAVCPKVANWRLPKVLAVLCQDASHSQHPSHPRQVAERAGQADLLRDVFGPLLFRPLPVIDPTWLVWNGGLVRRLAEEAYEKRCLPEGTLDPTRLVILSDALEEAGCTEEEELLLQLRSPKPHVRGSWVVDLILGLS
jgi:hypothetical protein